MKPGTNLPIFRRNVLLLLSNYSLATLVHYSHCFVVFDRSTYVVSYVWLQVSAHLFCHHEISQLQKTNVGIALALTLRGKTHHQ